MQVITKHKKLLDQALKVKSVDDIYDYCASLAKAFKFDFFCHSIVFKSSLKNPQFKVVSNYTEDWQHYYLTENCQDYDPVYAYIAKQIKPISWHKLMADQEHSKESHEFMSLAAENNLRSGMCFPVHGAYGEYGALTFSNAHIRDIDSELNDQIYVIDICCRYLHESAYKIYTHSNIYSESTNAMLTPREKECLLWCAEGKSNWDISHILDISESVVAKHLKNCCRKLGVFNRHHAVAKAINLGLFGIEISNRAKCIEIYSKAD